ncbi:MAG TPA: exonuclease domain-containing protein [Patescibacteria group bacterium]|nr:exonuclease domain-containing protein [Patescibacteria group bacterium]
MNTSPRYCSLDIETSGFDPLANEVLEVGFVFFEIDDGGTRITEEFTQVFRPSRPVPPNILALTGIGPQELEQAPDFKDYRQQLQDRLGDAVIIGHNIIFDLNFLEAFGLKFSGRRIDTLDLVQFLLPTHHSYNLENLMHAFGISHKEAHRALADSKATLKLLEKLLAVFQAFPAKLQTEIRRLLQPYALEWRPLLDFRLPPQPFPEQKEMTAAPAAGAPIALAGQTIYNFSLDQDPITAIGGSLGASQSKTALILPKARQVLDLKKRGLIDQALFKTEETFSSKKFSALKKRPDLTEEELRFVLKILVWQYTNWQTQTVLDLNTSFFGGQFKSLITGGERQKKTGRRLGCDLGAFVENPKLFEADRQLVIFGLSDFENALTGNLGTKASWGYISYLLKSYFNPELQTGQEEFKTTVETGLQASDLFFGLVGALLGSNPPSFQYVKILPETTAEPRYQKIKAAKENFAAKLAELNQQLNSQAITEFLANLDDFFKVEENRIKWIELAEGRCIFWSMPIEIKDLVKKLLGRYDRTAFADNLGPQTLPGFFAERLGLQNYRITNVGNEQKRATGQGELFTRPGSETLPAVVYHCLPETAQAEKLFELVSPASAWPAAVLFPSPLLARKFHETYYADLRQKVSLLVQNSSGGGNKIFRNFLINPQSLLLATDKFVLRQLAGNNQLEPVHRLPVKTLILCRLPFEQFTHPYQEALAQSFANSFLDYSLPKALFNFHQLLDFFYSPMLEQVFIIDPKLNKDYAKIFKEYWKFLPGAQPA